MKEFISITNASAICNLGDDLNKILKKTFILDNPDLTYSDKIVKGSKFYFGEIKKELPQINNVKYDLRCNRLILHTLNKLDTKSVINKYGRDNIAVVIGTTNSGIEEFEKSSNKHHAELSNPSEFIKNYLDLNNYYASVSTACTSGLKAFEIGKSLIENGVCNAAIVGGVDSLASLPTYGFNALEVLSKEKSIPFSKNRSGINIGEACALFILEKSNEGIKILGIGETSDAYHSATPNPEGVQGADAIQLALDNAGLKPANIDYINLHGTGTISNDLMESNAIYKIFQDKVPSSSTKPYTGHCLGAAASIETAICYELIKEQSIKLPLNLYDGIYDDNIPQIKLVNEQTKVEKIENCMITSFGFGGTNAVMIIGK